MLARISGATHSLQQSLVIIWVTVFSKTRGLNMLESTVHRIFIPRLGLPEGFYFYKL